MTYYKKLKIMKNTKLPKLLVIVGPTTTHKTKLAIEIANKFNGEIINADAFQVYKDMQIGTNAPTKIEKNSAKFHLNQFISIVDKWDVFKFKKLCKEKIQEITKNKKLAILVGGSNLYIDAIIKNYQLLADERTDEFTELSTETIYKLLYDKNKEIATKIGATNRRRLIRSLQIINQTNNLNLAKSTNKNIYDYLMIECNYPTRDDLYNSINKKVDEMFEVGWINEVKEIISKYKDIDWSKNQALKAIGYYDIYLSLTYKHKLDVELIKQKIRRYAKRQITWIRNKYGEHILFNQNNKPTIFKEINKWIKK